MKYFRLTIVWSFVAFVVLLGPSIVAQGVAQVT
jgi:hypothetical protein